MFARLRYTLLGGFLLLAATAAWAQTTITIAGTVEDKDGKPMNGAQISIVNNGTGNKYSVKSDKKGKWFYGSLPPGRYDVSLMQDGQPLSTTKGVTADPGQSATVDFDMQKVEAARAKGDAAAAAAGASGQELSADAEKGMTKEQKDKYEAAQKQRSEAVKKNKELNDTYNAGQDTLKAAAAETDKDKKAAGYQSAVDTFKKGTDLDPNQEAYWAGLGDAYSGLATTQTGDDKTKSYDAAIDAYQKAIALKPDAALYNQLGNVYGAEKKMTEATDALTKAAQLDPTVAPKAYFNMGANLVNTGQVDKAAEFFKKATDADPNYSEAWYQYGSLLMMNGKVDPKTGAQSYPPDTAAALQKYLQLQPNGAHAQEAQAMLQAMGETVQTKVAVKPSQTKKNTK